MDSFRWKHMMIYRKSKLLTDEDQLLFLQRLHRLLLDGYSLMDALKVIEWTEKFIEPAQIIKAEIMHGKYIDEAFQAANFHQTIVAYLYFVRFNHDFTISIKKALRIFEQQVSNRKKLTQVVRYPVILSIIFIVLLFVLKTSILPSFNELFQYNQGSSSSIMITMTVINMLVTIFIIVVVLAIVGFTSWKFHLRKLPIEDQIQYYKRIPLFRSFLRMQTSYYFTTHISMFLETGMSMKMILEQMSSQDKLPLIAFYANLMNNQLQNGFQLGHLIDNFYFIEKQIAYIFDQQQNNDTLEQDLRAYGEYVIDNLEHKTKKGMMLIQPIFFVVLACFIVFIYLALMWPMFQLIQTV